jgi:hypothetical protein
VCAAISAWSSGKPGTITTYTQFSEWRSARNDGSLLVSGNAFLVLDLSLHHFDGVARFNLYSDDMPVRLTGSRQKICMPPHTTARWMDRLLSSFCRLVRKRLGRVITKHLRETK